MSRRRAEPSIAALAALLAIWVAPVSASGSPISFSRADSYDRACQESYWLAVGDLNRDRRSDLVVGSDESFSSEGDCIKTGVLLAGPGGRFALARTFPWAAHVAVADFNGDGNTDLARADEMLLGDGRGGFPDLQTFPFGIMGSGGGGGEVVVADFNRDRRRDLAVAEPRGIWVLLGDGRGAFSRANLHPLPSQPFAVVVADFNRDRRPDLAAAGRGLRVLLGDGRGGFSAGARLVGTEPRSMAVADFNRDRQLDLVLLADDERGGVRVRILSGDGRGGFLAPRSVAAEADFFDAAAGDFNGDRKPDLALVYSSFDSRRNHVLVLPGNGRGGFSRPRKFASGGCRQCEPREVAVGNFNRDRRPDLVVLRGVDGGVSVLLNTTRR